MAEGTIKTIRDDKGFGFIAPEDGGKDIFFHASVVQDTTFDQLREGDRVSYGAGPDQRDLGRIRAEYVRLLD
jgi:CspA family cold shock protein